MAYCTIDDLKAFGYTFKDGDETFISQLCDAATARVDAYCHQHFTFTAGAEEKHRVRIRDGYVLIFPKNLVVRAINSVEFFNPLGRSPYIVTNPTWLENDAAIVAKTNAPVGADMIVTLNYDYGYDVIPAELTQAAAFMCLPIVDDYQIAADAGISGLKSLQQGKFRIERGDISSSTQYNEQGYPITSTTILDGNGYVRNRGDYL